MVFHLQFIDLVVGFVFIDDYSCYIRIAVDVIDCKFCEALAKHCVVCFVDKHWSVSETLVSVRVIHSACRSRFETCEDEWRTVTLMTIGI